MNLVDLEHLVDLYYQYYLEHLELHLYLRFQKNLMNQMSQMNLHYLVLLEHLVHQHYLEHLVHPELL